VNVHLIAACGVGMSALAGLLRAAGHRVTGSDENVYPPASTLLEALGIPVLAGWDAARLDGADLVVCGNAVRRTNPEAEAAAARGLRVVSMPAALAELFLAGRTPLVVAGTHGKTTSAAMLAWVLSRCGHDPGFLIGGVPRGVERSFAVGRAPWFVVEGDEYDSAYFDKGPKFLHYRPAMLLLTAIEFDHADIYRDLEHVKGAFAQLLAILPHDAPLVACGDFPHLRAVVAASGATSRSRLHWFGTGGDNAWQVDDLGDDGTATHFAVRERGGIVCRVRLRTPGAINARNALGVLLLARETGISWEDGAAALAEFQGVRRRHEVVGEGRGATVIDDFAHHPTAVAGTLAATRLRYPGRRLRAVFEPRSNTSRRRVFEAEFVDALALADEVVLAEVFAKTSDPIPPDERLRPEIVVRELAARGVAARSFAEVPAIRDYLLDSVRPGDVIVVMSNGAFGGLPGLVAAGLAA
jgi:UDP-N-acetylmuramate: L-alanyl-gamma-D-glutamyl-meso-diaminopimelate ligase